MIMHLRRNDGDKSGHDESMSTGESVSSPMEKTFDVKANIRKTPQIFYIFSSNVSLQYHRYSIHSTKAGTTR